jgi:hypothetical protein
MSGMLPYFDFAVTYSRTLGEPYGIPMPLMHVFSASADGKAASAGIFFSLN